KAIEESLRQADHPTRGLGLLVMAACHSRRNDEARATDARERAGRWLATARAVTAGMRNEFERFRAESGRRGGGRQGRGGDTSCPGGVAPCTARSTATAWMPGSEMIDEQILAGRDRGARPHRSLTAEGHQGPADPVRRLVSRRLAVLVRKR